MALKNASESSSSSSRGSGLCCFGFGFGLCCVGDVGDEDGVFVGE